MTHRAKQSALDSELVTNGVEGGVVGYPTSS